MRPSLRIIAALTAATSLQFSGCGAPQNTGEDLPEARFSETEVSSAALGEGSLDAVLDDLDELEAALRDPFLDAADLEIHAFRLGRLLDDLDAYLRDDDSPHLRVAFGRALALSSLLQHPGADILAEAMFLRALELDPEHHVTHLLLGRLYLDHQRFADAVDAFEQAEQAGLAPRHPELALWHAAALEATGQFSLASTRLQTYIEAYPEDPRALELRARIDRGDDERGQIRIGLEGQALVHYDLLESRFAIRHESLGFSVELPLDWQISHQEVDLESGGILELTPPPSLGMDRAWQSDIANLWVIQLRPGEDLTHIRDAYFAAQSDAVVLQPLDTLGHVQALRGLLSKLNEQGGERYGDVFMMQRGDTAYVFEYWGDPVSYLGRAHEIDAIIGSLSPILSDPVAATP